MQSSDIHNFKSHADTERKIIHLMLKSREVIDEMLDSGLGSDFFDVVHQPLVDAIYYEYRVSERRRLLIRETYRQYLTQQNVGSELLLNLSVYDQCLVGTNSKQEELSVLKARLQEGYIARQCSFFLKDFNKDFGKHGALYAARNLSDKLQQGLSITETRRTVYASLPEIKDDYLAMIDQQRGHPDLVIRCQIPEIDDSVNVGFKPQHLTLIVAPESSHKSNLMLNIGLNVADANHNVLFVPLEMNRFDLTNRIVANRCGIDFHCLARPELLSDEQRKLMGDTKMWKSDRFCILDADERTSVSDLKREIEKRAVDFKPSVVIIDYIANLKADVRFGSRNDLEIGEILKSLRFLGKKYGFHIITAAQMNRAAITLLREGKEDAVDSTSIHGSLQYAADSDTIFALYCVNGEPTRLKCYVIKARHGVKGEMKELRVDPAHCRITSTKDSLLTDPGGLTDLDNDLNIPTADIAASAAVEFSSVSLDDDVSGLG